jgi:hypothetical protein
MKEFRLPVAREAAWMEATIHHLTEYTDAGHLSNLYEMKLPRTTSTPANISFVNLSINTHAFVR